MAVTLASVAKQVNAQMNLAVTWSATVTDPRSYTEAVTEAILAADGDVVGALLSNPTNGRRKDFITSATVAHAGALPSRIGAIDSVLISSVPATPAPLTEITWDRGTSLTYLPARYAIFGNRLFHNQGASSATVEYATYARTSACQAPDEYADAVLCGALALMFSIEGEADGTAAMYAGQFQAMLAAIRGGQMPESFVSYEKAA